MKNETANQVISAPGAASLRDPLFFIDMTTAQRGTAVRNMLWGYENGSLLLHELIGLIRGEYGVTAQGLFTKTLTEGVRQPQSDRLISFASLCALYSNWDALEQVATAAKDGFIKVDGEPVTVSDWLDKLASRCGLEGGANGDTKFVFDLYRMAVQFKPDRARMVLDIALRHQPGHPGIEKLLEAGGTSGAVLAEMLMERQIATIEVGPVAAEASNTSRRRRMGF